MKKNLICSMNCKLINLILIPRSEKERKKRIQKIEGIKEKLEESKMKVRAIFDTGANNGINTFNGNANNGVDLEAKPLFQKGDDGEYEDTRGKDNRQVLT